MGAENCKKIVSGIVKTEVKGVVLVVITEADVCPELNGSVARERQEPIPPVEPYEHTG